MTGSWFQDWGEKDERGWRKSTEGGESEWRRPVPDRCGQTRLLPVLWTSVVAFLEDEIFWVWRVQVSGPVTGPGLKL